MGPGKVLHDPNKRAFKRTRDVKRAAVEFYSFVDMKFRKIRQDNRPPMEDFVEESKSLNEEQEEEQKEEKKEEKVLEGGVNFETKKKMANFKKNEYLKRIEESKIKQQEKNEKKNKNKK